MRSEFVKHAVVTGGAGFIGSHVVARLLDDGFAVRIVDNLSTGRIENIEAVCKAAQDSTRVVLHRIDLADAEGLAAICEGAEFVFHLAALADIVPSIENPLKYHRANVDGTVNLLEAIRSAGGVGKIVYAASSSCYGIPDELPTTETAAIRPQYPYALTKYTGEQYVHHWSQVYGIDAVSLRFFNVYGPRARTRGAYGAVFGVFLAQKLAGQPLTIVGDGTQTRDFVYVTDVAEACLRVAKSDVSGEVFNVGTGNPQSINHLCANIGGPTVHLPKRPGEPDCTWADISKIRRVLDWEPTVCFDEGTERMLATLDDYSDAPVWTPDSIADVTTDWFKYLGDPVTQHA